MGAGLTSMRYALVAGHDVIIDGVRLPVAYIGQTDLYQSGVNGIAVDAPGTRDLRWDSSKTIFGFCDGRYQDGSPVRK